MGIWNDDEQNQIEFYDNLNKIKSVRIVKNKGELMKAVYTKKELQNIDSAIPIEYWNGKNPEIQVDTAIHVVNYNQGWGVLENMEKIAVNRKIKIKWI